MLSKRLRTAFAATTLLFSADAAFAATCGCGGGTGVGEDWALCLESAAGSVLPLDMGNTDSETPGTASDRTIDTFHLVFMSGETKVAGDFDDSSVLASDRFVIDIPRVKPLEAWGIGWRYEEVEGLGLAGFELAYSRSDGVAPAVFAPEAGHPDGYPTVYWNMYMDYYLGLRTPAMRILPGDPWVGALAVLGLGYQDLSIQDSGFTSSEQGMVEYGQGVLRYGVGIQSGVTVMSLPVTVAFRWIWKRGGFASLKFDGEKVEIAEEDSLDPSVAQFFVSIALGV